MRRYLAAALLASFAAVPLIAQAPEGWMMRADRSTSASDPDAPGPIRFMTMGSAFHATTPQAAVFWHPDNRAAGSYTLKGTFKLLKPSGHTNYYGLVFGGNALEGAAQRYLYFMVAQDGTWLIKRRDGAAAEDVSAKTPHPAVRRPDANGQSVNDLEVRIGADKVDFVVNGTVVHSAPKSGTTAATDGLYGLRVNHLLDVEVSNFGIAG
jgi:hypothetical protein